MSENTEDRRDTSPPVSEGDSIVITDAFGVEHAAIALSGVEGTHRDGRKIHDFPIVWVRTVRGSRIPWPREDVRLP